jgi:periplasmic protein TonB
MRDAVDSVIEAREALDHGFSGSLLMSGLVHGLLVGGAFLAAFLAPKAPLVRISNFAVMEMRGGRGTPNPAPQAPAAPPVTQPAAKTEPAPEPAAPPQIAKPPQPVERKGLPEPDAKKPTTKPSARPEPSRPTAAASTQAGTPIRATTGGGTGTTSGPVGLEFLPDGAGVGTGLDNSDYYMAGVQRKVWQIWLQQIKQTFPQPVIVSFTLNPDGSVSNVQVAQSSGVAMIDLAARRAVQTAAPFSPFPKDYANRPLTIQARFTPTS